MTCDVGGLSFADTSRAQISDTARLVNVGEYIWIALAVRKQNDPALNSEWIEQL